MNKPVSFEIARLLKDKKIIIHSEYRYTDFDGIERLEKNADEMFPFAPTIAEVIMWLYEKHGIWITVNLLIEEMIDRLQDWFFYEVNGKEWDVENIRYSEEYYSPTEAYSEAIKRVLNTLI